MQTVYDFLKKVGTYYIANVVYYLKDVTATFYTFGGKPRIVQF